MAGFISWLKALFGIKHKPTPREMAEAQIRQIEQAIMEYNSKDRALHRDKENATRDGREADTKLKETQRKLDDLPAGDDSFTRQELASSVAELQMEVEKAKSKMTLAEGNILQNRQLLEGAEKTLIRLRGALEAGIPPTQLLQIVKEVADMGDRYDMAVTHVGDQIGSLFGAAAENADRLRKEALAASDERRRMAQIASQAGTGTQSAANSEHPPRPLSSSQY